LQKHSLSYTAHIGYGLDLRNIAELELHKKVLFSSIRICAELGIGLLNLHFEEETRFADKEEAFLKAHLEAANLGEEIGDTAHRFLRSDCLHLLLPVFHADRS